MDLSWSSAAYFHVKSQIVVFAEATFRSNMKRPDKLFFRC